MALSSIGLRSALDQMTSQVWLECLTLTHASISTLRLVNDKKDLVRSAGTYIAFPFEFQDFVRSDDQSVSATITVSNVDQRIVQALRSLVGKPNIAYEVVLADTPNVIERGPMDFICQQFTSNIKTITLTVAFKLNILNNAFPKDQFAPWNSTA